MRFPRASTVSSLLLVCRLVLGGIFIAAGLSKVAHLSEFAVLVGSYGLLPGAVSLIYGYVVPWLEIVLGVLLVLGLFTRQVAVLGFLLTLSFVVANVFGFFHKIEDTCGCFGQLVTLGHSQSLLIDLLMVGLVLPIFIWAARSPSIGRWLTRRWSGSPGLLLNRAAALFLMVSLLAASFQFVPVRTVAAADNPPGALVGAGNSETNPPQDLPVGSVDSQIRASLAAGKSVFLYFYAEWCGYCQKEKPIIATLKENFAGKVAFISLDQKNNSVEFEQFGVKSFPTMILISGLNPDDTFVSQKIIGFNSEEALSKILAEACGEVVDQAITAEPQSIKSDLASGNELSASPGPQPQQCGGT